MDKSKTCHLKSSKNCDIENWFKRKFVVGGIYYSRYYVLKRNFKLNKVSRKCSTHACPEKKLKKKYLQRYFHYLSHHMFDTN